MRAALLLMLLLAAALAGCSRPVELVTPQPLLRPRDAAGAPRFRSGLWRFIWPNYADNPCPFDAGRPIEAWPACDAPQRVSPDRMVAVVFVQTPLGLAATERRHPYALAAGSPLVLQRYGEVYRGRYSYDAVDRLELDAAGRIVAARLTAITCFDPASFTAAMAWQANTVTDDNTHPIDDGAAPSAELALMPGFFRDARGDCLPRDLSALRNAAAADAGAATEGVNFRWVRDGDR